MEKDNETNKGKRKKRVAASPTDILPQHLITAGSDHQSSSSNWQFTCLTLFFFLPWDTIIITVQKTPTGKKRKRDKKNKTTDASNTFHKKVPPAQMKSYYSESLKTRIKLTESCWRNAFCFSLHTVVFFFFNHFPREMIHFSLSLPPFFIIKVWVSTEFSEDLSKGVH